MSEQSQQSVSENITTIKSGLKWCSLNRHFMISAIILATVWLGWTAIMKWGEMFFSKEAVAWPVGVDVHPTEFRMLSLAESFGPENRFEIAADGELFRPKNGELFVTDSGEVLEGVNGVLMYKNRTGRQRFAGKLTQVKYKRNNEPVLDGVPDGERTIGVETLESLAIGTALDYSTYEDRKSTWYVSRTYVDRTKSLGQEYSLWQLDVTYYTGTLDKAPHFPERCLVAAGMILGLQGNEDFEAPGPPSPWGDRPVTCRFVEYTNPRGNPGNLNVQYYVYSLNGVPESSWKQVRLQTASPFGKYSYFAKIQFNPLTGIRNADEAKQATSEFVKYMLPEVLKSLPMPEYMKRLESGVE